MKLVIVESPTKASTIKRYLGKDYRVLASYGHIRDLAKDGIDNLGVDIDNNFLPHYEISEGKNAIVTRLLKASQEADEVYLATDPDREGEAISWHLAKVLNLNLDTTKRLEFHEITSYGISNALENMRLVDQNLVNSQETRRIIDRIIGFKLSQLVNRKLKSKSAGRVQSVVLKLLVDREREIAAFIPTEKWNINVTLKNGKNKLNASLTKINGEKANIPNEEEKNKIIELIPEKLKIINIIEEEKKNYAKPAYVTSSLQIDAFSKYKFSTSKTMKIAQELFEGIKTKKGLVGLITYMRTDSIRLAPLFVSQAKKFIEENYGKEYVGKGNTIGSNKAGVQDAHEAIRPTHIELTPESLKDDLTSDQFKLYTLIYNRALASIMTPRVSLEKEIIFGDSNLEFVSKCSKTIFAGHTILSLEKKSKEKFIEFNTYIDEIFDVIEINDEQEFSKPPVRYSEARLVKEMEDLGIGRPSTYASTIETIKKTYAKVEGGVLIPTEQGILTNDKLQDYFKSFINVKYTAKMEKELDNIATSKTTKETALNEFYLDFIKLYDKANIDMEYIKVLPTGKFCPNCGKPLVIRKGKYSEFYGCSGFPNCNYMEKKEIETPKNAKKCPNCKEGFLVKRNGKFGAFLSCNKNCGYTESFKGRIKKN